METPYRKECSQDFARVRKDLFYIKNGRFGTNINLTLYKALISSVMNYYYPPGSVRWTFTS
jgi:hypothetical protein